VTRLQSRLGDRDELGGRIVIELRDVHKYFGTNHVLRGVNLTVPRGKTLVVIGRSGCGKSVLLRVMIGLLRPDSGTVLFDGEDITTMSERQMNRIRLRTGMLFQNAALFDSLTVAENVGFGLKQNTSTSDAEIARIVAGKLAVVDLAGVESKYPSELSGGMRKRVGLARAIAMDPALILYDEPTTGLDPIMADVINTLIVKLKRTMQTTAVAVTHDMTSAYKIADRIVMLHDGIIVAEGAPDEVHNTADPLLGQFIRGEAEGPIPVGV
jgi:phospholipid/cholesterol/gamma-HCH transport system ATP-binding protein